MTCIFWLIGIWVAFVIGYRCWQMMTKTEDNNPGWGDGR